VVVPPWRRDYYPRDARDAAEDDAAVCSDHDDLDVADDGLENQIEEVNDVDEKLDHQGVDQSIDYRLDSIGPLDFSVDNHFASDAAGL